MEKKVIYDWVKIAKDINNWTTPLDMPKELRGLGHQVKYDINTEEPYMLTKDKEHYIFCLPKDKRDINKTCAEWFGYLFLHKSRFLYVNMFDYKRVVFREKLFQDCELFGEELLMPEKELKDFCRSYSIGDEINFLYLSKKYLVHPATMKKRLKEFDFVE
jgi:Zn-dependent peptidase ImmA (M78 family)